MRAVDPRLLRHARPARALLVVLVALGAGTAGLVIAQAVLLAGGITAVVTRGAGPAALAGTAAALAAVIAGRAALAWLTEALSVRASAAVKSRLRGALLHRVTALGPGHPAADTGRLATLAGGGLDALDGYFARYLPQLVLSVLVPAAILAVVLPTDLTAGGTIALTLPLIPLFLILVGLATDRATTARRHALVRLAHHFLDVIAGLPTLTVFGRARRQAAAVRAITDDYRRATLSTLRLAFLSALVLELAATLSVALVAVGVGLRLVDGHLGLRTALLLLILAPEAYLPLRALGAQHHASADGRTAAEEVLTVLDTPAPDRHPLAATAPAPAPRVRVENLTVTHPDRPAPAPDGVTLDLAPGRITALTGASGCGKSTLIAALLGFATPSGGRILADGTDLSTLDADGWDAWRHHIGWAAQSPYLVVGTVADNIRLGRAGAPDALVAAAAHDAALDVPLDRPVGERGTGLSAGQRRRVALARAFLRDTPLLLLDEPTAGLDPATEQAILRRLRALADTGRAILLVAHRPAALAAADDTVTLTGARVPTQSRVGHVQPV